MVIDALKKIFTRDLLQLKKEIEAYKDENNLWKIENGIANSGGNLCLHLIGNLNTYIGREIGKFEYVRKRELEFSLKNIPKVELTKKVDYTISIVNNSLDKLTIVDLEQDYPFLVFDKPTSTLYMLVHLTTHLTYHLGQINYHRRLLDK